MPTCNYCHEEVQDMDVLSDHVADEHDAITAAVHGDLTHLAEEMQKGLGESTEA